MKNFLFVSYSYLSRRDDVPCGWPPAEPPAPPAPSETPAPSALSESPAAAAGFTAGGPACIGKSCHDRQTGMPERVAGPG
ncbi:hypothetical protein [Burkholderia plantarii]|uniref:hypothetical protein n=1 Tax=Burkholderia plantarii TaxID=41899 RepID=UPI0018DCDD33|nr:hypothetical protein [Burkholderia plantarii]